MLRLVDHEFTDRKCCSSAADLFRDRLWGVLLEAATYDDLEVSAAVRAIADLPIVSQRVSA